MTLLKSLLTFTAAMFFAGSVIAQDTPIKEYSSDNRLMKNVTTMEVLENGMVLHFWEWNDTAKALDAKYEAPEEDGGFAPMGLIAQDVQAKYPDAVIEDSNGYLNIDLPVLIDQDELIAKMVLEGGASAVWFAADGGKALKCVKEIQKLINWYPNSGTKWRSKMWKLQAGVCMPDYAKSGQKNVNRAKLK